MRMSEHVAATAAAMAIAAAADQSQSGSLAETTTTATSYILETAEQFECAIKRERCCGLEWRQCGSQLLHFTQSSSLFFLRDSSQLLAITGANNCAQVGKSLKCVVIVPSVSITDYNCNCHGVGLIASHSS
jgi:hypothetical protein